MITDAQIELRRSIQDLLTILYICYRTLDYLTRMMRKAALVYIIAILYGCGGGPGAPLVRTDGADGVGSLIRGCENISSFDKTNNFITDRYLTTWGSASSEGAAVGYYEGLKDARFMGDDAEKKRFAYARLPSSAIFCRAYSAERSRVFHIVATLMPQLGYRLVDTSQDDGFLETDYVDGAHYSFGAELPFAKWKDRYAVKVGRKRDDRVVVKVFRDVYISRCNANRGDCSDYIRATSVGHNEAVILNRIEQELSVDAKL